VLIDYLDNLYFDNLCRLFFASNLPRLGKSNNSSPGDDIPERDVTYQLI